MAFKPLLNGWCVGCPHGWREAMRVVLILPADKRSSVNQPPLLLPKRKRQERRVFLDIELWAAMDEVAEFHQAVFKEMGADESVSRNDMISAFLEWAASSYWEDKGGRPASKADLHEKVK